MDNFSILELTSSEMERVLRGNGGLLAGSASETTQAKKLRRKARLKKGRDAYIMLGPNADEFNDIPNAFRGTDVGNLPPHTKKEDRVKALNAYLKVAQVPESEWAAFIEKVEIELARVTRPKWVGRLERGGELATLSAPLFLKRVHADYIGEDGTVENETIRAIDPDLMKAVEVYLSARRTRAREKQIPLTLGDAEGLNFVLARPSIAVGSTKKNPAP